MTRIDLLRHAESQMNTNRELVGGRSNHTPLTDAGARAARERGVRFARENYRPDAIYCSPARRTLATAQLVVSGAGWRLPIATDERLQELSQGDAEGQPRPEWWTPASLSAMTTDPLGHRLAANAECHLDVQERMLAAVHDIARRHRGATVLVVGHGIAIRTLLWAIAGGPHVTFQGLELPNLGLASLEIL